MLTTRNCIEIFGDPNEYQSNLIRYTVPREIIEVIEGLRNPYYIKTILLNPLVEKAINNVLTDICLFGLEEEIRSYNGCFKIRSIRGKEDDKIAVNGIEYPYYSIHLWALAFDFNAETNKMGTKGDMHPDIVKIFKFRGFDWGGDFNDPQHFQASKELIGI